MRRVIVISYLGVRRAQRPTEGHAAVDIKGSISQLDENLIHNRRASVSPFLNLGAAKMRGPDMLALDLSVLTADDMAILAGVTSRNSVIVLKQGDGLDGDAAYHKFGIDYSMSLSKAEATQALRGLIELAVIELLGKLTKTPYWTCLGATPKKNDETR